MTLFDWSDLGSSRSPAPWENVQFISDTGKVIWTINGMEHDPFWQNKSDAFIDIASRDQELIAISFSGNVFKLDIMTGQVSFIKFVK